jgi:hypothetical protein
VRLGLLAEGDSPVRRDQSGLLHHFTLRFAQ